MRFMLEIKRDIFTGEEKRKFFTKEEIEDYNFDSFKEIDNSLLKDYLKKLDFIKLWKTKIKIVDNTEIVISGIEIDDSVLEEEDKFVIAIDRLNEFESKIA